MAANKQLKDFREDSVKRSEFEAHCEANLQTDHKLDKLMPLVDLVPTLNEIVEEKKALTFISSKMIKIITGISLTVGVIYGIFKLVQEIMQSLRR